jgi:hypothetical protein
LARFEGNFKAAGEARVDADELHAALSRAAGKGGTERHDAIACFLSASEGWRDAKEALKGTFAGVSRASWLKDGKE